MSSTKTTHRLKSAGRPKGDTEAKSILAKKLQAVCGDGNYSDFASLFGVSSVSVSRYLTGAKIPVIAAIAHLHVATGVDLNWLLDDSDERPGPVFIKKKKA